MNVAEIAADCGLSLEDADRAKQREFDEPFRLEEDNPEDLERIASLAQHAGLNLTMGGRYHHLSAGSDKGRAVRTLCGLLEKPGKPLLSVGIGDSPNDLPMLKAVDLPMLVMRSDGAYHPQLVDGAPQALRVPGVGPEGWNLAISGLLAREVHHGA
jgi:mannosyl-3-phosphoglycerate phosphatase